MYITKSDTVSMYNIQKSYKLYIRVGVFIGLGCVMSTLYNTIYVVDLQVLGITFLYLLNHKFKLQTWPPELAGVYIWELE